VIGPEALLLRFFHDEGDRLLLLNLGTELRLASCSDPLIAPPAGHAWTIVWSSDDLQYGGDGTAPFDPADLRLPPHALLVLAPAPHPIPLPTSWGEGTTLRAASEAPSPRGAGRGLG
jgi:maltooligosyltrehalose trehalohydrolase